MPLTRTPNSLSIFDRFNLSEASTYTTGNVFFVGNSVTAASDNAGSRGDTPEQPFSTIDFAVNQCAANNGDQIYVLPGHEELFTATTDLTLDVNGVSVFGLGSGLSRPIIQYDNANGAVTWTASNCRVSNLIFEASIASITEGVVIDNTSQHNEIDNCRWTFDATGVEFTVMLKLGNGGTDSADYVTVRNNWFEAENIDGCASAILIDDCQFVHIINNLFTGDFNSVCIDGAAGSSACLDYVIAGNLVQQLDTSQAIDLDDSATGICFNNRVAVAGALATAGCDWGACASVENYVTDAADASGVLVPATTAA